MKISEIQGKPIVSMADGEKLGTVKDVLIDVDRLQATALIIDSSPGQGFLPFDRVKSFRPDDITIENRDGIQWTSGQAHVDKGREGSELMRLWVVDPSGSLTGAVRELIVDLPKGNLRALNVRKGGVFGIGAETVDVPVSDIVSIGTSRVTVRQMLALQPAVSGRSGRWQSQK